MSPHWCPCCNGSQSALLWLMCDRCRTAMTSGAEHACERPEDVKPPRVHTSDATAWQALTRVRALSVADIEAVLLCGPGQFHPTNTRQQALAVYKVLQEAIGG